MESKKNNKDQKDFFNINLDKISLSNELKQEYEKAKKINEIEKTKTHKLYRESYYFVFEEDTQEDNEITDLNMEFNFSKEGINVVKLIESLNKLIRHYSIFGLIFNKIKSEEYIQIFKPELIQEIKEEYIEENEIIKIREELHKNKFNIFNNLLYKIKLYISPQKIYLFFLFHHSIVDGNSIKILFNSLKYIYEDKELLDDLYFYFINKISYENEKNKEISNYYEKMLIDGNPDRSIKIDKILNTDKPKRNISLFDLSDLYVNFINLFNKSGHKINIILIMSLLITICIYNKSNKSIIYAEHNGRFDKIERCIVGNFLRVVLFRHDFKIKEKVSDFYNDIENQIAEQKIRPLNMFTVDMKIFDDNPIICLNNRFNLFDFGKFQNNIVMHDEFYSNKDDIEPNELTSINLEIDVIDDKMKLSIEYDNSKYKKGSINKFHEIFIKSAKFLVANWNSSENISLINFICI